jgi:hypothetical protein
MNRDPVSGIRCPGSGVRDPVCGIRDPRIRRSEDSGIRGLVIRDE